MAQKAKELSSKELCMEYLRNSEANLVACMFKDPQSFIAHDDLEDKFLNNVWRVFYVIGRDMVTVEDKAVLDEISIGFYLEKHEKLLAKYMEYGGYNTIKSLMMLAQPENIDGYLEETQKYMAILALIANNFAIVPDRLKEFKDMKAEDIYAFYETVINDIFVNVQAKIVSYNLLEGLETMIDEADKGLAMGLPLNESAVLNGTIGGSILGNLTLLGANSGVGKTTMSILLLLESVIKNDEKMVIVINEEDQIKWQRELLTYYVNSKYGGAFKKKRWREGGFTKEEKELLLKAAKHLAELKAKRNLTIIPLQKYKTDTVIKIIRKYTGLGVKYFILDTFKSDADDMSELQWQKMAQAMVKLYDTVKPAGKNVHLWVTLQLSKASIVQRYLTQNNIGQAKNVIDVASVALLTRYVMQEEKQGGKNELKVFRLEGKNMQTKVQVDLDKDKTYIIIFIDKNRFGEAKTFQVVAEIDWSYNRYKEIGITRVPEDF